MDNSDTSKTTFDTQTVDRMARVTLNSGLINKLDDETARMIEDFIQKNGVKKLQPAGATGNEASRHTNERIAQARRDFRKAQREKNKKG